MGARPRVSMISHLMRSILVESRTFCTTLHMCTYPMRGGESLIQSQRRWSWSITHSTVTNKPGSGIWWSGIMVWSDMIRWLPLCLKHEDFEIEEEERLTIIMGRELVETWRNSPWCYTAKRKQRARCSSMRPRARHGWQLRSITPIGRQQVWCAYNEDIWSKEGPGGGQWKIQSIEPIKEPDSKVRVRVHGASLCIHDGGRGRPRTRDLQRCFPRFLVDWGNERGDALIVRQWYLGFSPSLWNQKEANWLPLGVQDKA